MAFEFSNTSEGFENAKAWVDLICLRFANVILTNLTGFDGVQYTRLVKLSNKVSNKVVAVVCR